MTIVTSFRIDRSSGHDIPYTAMDDTGPFTTVSSIWRQVPGKILTKETEIYSWGWQYSWHFKYSKFGISAYVTNGNFFPFPLYTVHPCLYPLPLHVPLYTVLSCLYPLLKHVLYRPLDYIIYCTAILQVCMWRPLRRCLDTPIRYTSCGTLASWWWVPEWPSWWSTPSSSCSPSPPVSPSPSLASLRWVPPTPGT